MKLTRWWIIGCLVLSLVSGVDAQKSKHSTKQLSSKLRNLNQKKAAIQKEISKTRRESKEVAGDIQWVDREMDRFANSIEQTQQELDQSRRAQTVLVKELGKAKLELGKKQDQLGGRLRSIYMQNSKSPVTAILSSRSLGDLASRKAVLERVAAQDRELFEEVKVKLAEVAVKKAKQDAVVKKIATLVERQRDYKAELYGAKVRKRGYLSQLYSKAESLNEQYDALDRESDSIAAQIQAYQARYSSAPVFRGGFIRPVAGRITSGFGNRFHPILKRSRLHAGVDFGAGTGTRIVAAGSGTVISAGYRGGYGNAVVIDHGGGVSTLYGHCSRIYVSAGQRVTRGQQIAAVGSTGLATGPHLHFEVRVNGRPVNPMSRL
ncbi:MAG: peptidoglycan DD-metalloendopeptidase family protein [Fimbriimonadaceae bacterium]|nr:peptidoglycan DD-metalloendopeptidase family protein [Fimbriimonadaceae bacterium]